MVYSAACQEPQFMSWISVHIHGLAMTAALVGSVRQRHPLFLPALQIRLLEANINRDMNSSKPVAQKRLKLPKVSKKREKQKAKKAVKHCNKMTEPSSCTPARDNDHSIPLKTKNPRTVRRPWPVNERPPQSRKPQWLMMHQQSR